MENAVFETDLKHLDLIHRGKVRDIYDVDDQHMLIVTSDRLSAFDVILPDAIPAKGKILTTVSNFWFEQLGGIELPEGLVLADKLPEAIFTPSTKASVGDHDENINFREMCDLVGKDLAQQIRDISLQLYTTAAEFALKKGIIIADTKFEFGLDAEGTLTLIDEALTPDSSRFWPLSEYRPGMSPPSFDKQFVRDYLETLDWDKTTPGPHLPDNIVQRSSKKYQELARLLTK